METAPRNCRFLSLVVVELVLTTFDLFLTNFNYVGVLGPLALPQFHKTKARLLKHDFPVLGLRFDFVFRKFRSTEGLCQQTYYSRDMYVKN